MRREPHSLDRSTIAALCLWAAMGCVAVVLMARAIAGALDAPVRPAIPLLVTLLTLGGGIGGWTLFHREGRRGDVGRRLFDGLLATLPAAVAGYTASVHADPATLAAVTCLLTAGLAYVACHEGTRGLTAEMSGNESADADLPHVRSIPHPSGPTEDNAREDSSELQDRHPLQQTISRRRLGDDSEEIEAVLIATFASGERQSVLHVPFHPVLRGSIHVECEPLEDASIAVQATVVRAYGVRIEVKRSRHIDQPAAMPVGVHIIGNAAESAA